MNLYEGSYKIVVEAENATHAAQKLYDCFCLCSDAIVDGEAPCVSSYGSGDDVRKLEIATCGACGRSWDDSLPTSWTPAPSGRCPFEYFHDGEAVPSDFPVQPIDLEEEL